MKKYNGFYLMGNYPDKRTFIDSAVKGLQHFDFLEVGIPFSDPIADGQVIADAAQHVLDKGITFKDIACSISEINEKTAGKKDIYLMTYANIILNQERDYLNSLHADTEIKGLIIPDIPFCEKDVFSRRGRSINLPLISFITPETEEDSIEEICREGENFIYFISRRGITGGRAEIETETVKKLELSRKLASCPVVLGFGISDAQSASSALKIADGFITGTAMINALNEGGYQKFVEFTENIFR